MWDAEQGPLLPETSIHVVHFTMDLYQHQLHKVDAIWHVETPTVAKIAAIISRVELGAELAVIIALLLMAH